MAIVSVYAALVAAGRRGFSQVPANLQVAVESELQSQGLGVDGKPVGSA
ncbi:CD1375 family protein [Paenibacillus paeoniae]|nr:CD1375 family protein [Paenibacillus paeoniae]